jgi:toxin ParE1/3/4
LKRYEVYFLAEAIDDIDALFCYIAKEASFEVAARYLARIERLCLSLDTFPLRGTAVSGGIPGLHTMGFEHRVTILFKVGEKRVEILRILYGGRDLGPQIEKLIEE